jgi:stress response protein YsnF
MSAEETRNGVAGPRARQQPRAAGKRLPLEAQLESSGETWTIRVPVRKEEVRAEKQLMVTGEVEVSKLQREEMATVSGTVHREEAHVETTGDANERVKGDLEQPRA